MRARKITMEKNLTNGSVFKNILLFSLPYLLSYFLQTLYGMADLFIIGQFEGVAATTAVSVGSQVMHMLTVMIVGLAMGTTVSIAQAVGSGDRNSASRDVGNTVTLFMAVSVVMTVVLLLSVRAIVAAMSTPAEAADGIARLVFQEGSAAGFVADGYEFSRRSADTERVYYHPVFCRLFCGFQRGVFKLLAVADEHYYLAVRRR